MNVGETDAISDGDNADSLSESVDEFTDNEEVIQDAEAYLDPARP